MKAQQRFICFLSVFFLHLTSLSIYAQMPSDSTNKSQSTTTPNRIKNKNSVFLEIGGSAILGSVNYDRIFSQTGKSKLSFRTGISFYKETFVIKSLVFIIPTEINLLRGKEKHFLELGFGITSTLGNRIFTPGSSYLVVIKYFYDYFIIPRIGYRYQPTGNLLFFRIGFTPIFMSGNYSYGGDYSPVHVWGLTFFQRSVPYFGISLGYCF